jgi:peptidoglycan/LPS O-acetylase OafA/YrhL
MTDSYFATEYKTISREDKIVLAPRRLDYLESLRGLAALFVFLHHHYMTAPIFLDVVRLTPLRFLINGRSSVIFFFVLSGFVIVYGIANSSRKFSYPNFVLRRIIRIYLPYVASGLIAIVCYFMLHPKPLFDTAITFNEMWSEHLRLGTVAQFLLLAGTPAANTINSVAWSLVYELRISLLLPFLFLLGIRIPWVLWLFVVVELVANRFRQDSVPFHGTDVFSSLDVTVHFVLPFVLGIFLAIRFSRGAIPDLDATPIRAGFLLCVALILLMIFRDESASLGAAILLFVALGWRKFQDVLRWPLLIKLGTISYSLYLTHAIVLQVMVRAFHGAIPLGVSLALSLVASIGVAIVFYRFVEKPTHRLSQWVGQQAVPSRSGRPSGRAE